MSSNEFNHLLVSNSEYLKPYALVLTRDTESAKDLLQETIYRALANREKYNVGTNIKAWLYTILRNIFINDYRKKVRQQSVVVKKFEWHDHYFGSCPNKESTSVKEIMVSIHSLPAIFSQPFHLYFEGYKYEEIATVLDEPLGTIKSRIHLARKILKERISRY